MTDIERDPLVRRAVDELRRLPATDDAAVARVVAAAAAARVAAADDEPVMLAARPSRTRWWTVGGVAAAAAIAGFLISNARRAPVAPGASPAVAASPVTGAGVELQPVGSNSADGLPITKQFVFHSRTARSVSVVGDFNRWNAETTRMTRATDGDLWSVTLPIMPGRHLYGFMVDDSVFVLDPREQKGRDADLGVEASVIIVGRP
jgi:hypothetical protein